MQIIVSSKFSSVSLLLNIFTIFRDPFSVPGHYFIVICSSQSLFYILSNIKGYMCMLVVLDVIFTVGGSCSLGVLWLLLLPFFVFIQSLAM